MFVEEFYKIYEKLGFKLRDGIGELVNQLDEVRKRDEAIIFVSFPTGYGKSSLSFILGELVRRELFREDILNVLHVLPMRSIVENLLSRARDWREKLGSDIVIGAQCSSPLGSFKDPIFIRNLVYTTFDSYFLNMFKITVNIRSPFSYFELPRSMIYSSFSIFDEAHLFMDVDVKNAYTILVTVVDSLLRAKLPVLIMTATLPISVIRNMIAKLDLPENTFRKILILDSEDDRKGTILRIRDKEWLEEMTNVKYITKFVKDEEVIKLVKEHVGTSSKILIVRNTVKRVYDTFVKIRDFINNVVVIHGRLRICDRMKALNKIESESPPTLSTQVIEAGVDIDYDKLITDMAPLSQLVQRVGRIVRKPTRSRNIGYVYIIGDVDPVPYDKELVDKSREVLKRTLEKHGEILWRVPNYGKENSYLKLLEDVYSEEIVSKLEIDINIRVKLDIIDSYITITRNEILKYGDIDELCSLLREGFIIPVIVLKKRSIEPKDKAEITDEIIREFEEELNGAIVKSLYEVSHYLTVPIESSYITRKENINVISFKGKTYIIYGLSYSDVLKLYEVDSREFIRRVYEGKIVTYLGELERRITRREGNNEKASIIAILGNPDRYLIEDKVALGYI